MPKGCEHALTEVLDVREGRDDAGAELVIRVEACWMCGWRRTLTERGGGASVRGGVGGLSASRHAGPFHPRGLTAWTSYQESSMNEPILSAYDFERERRVRIDAAASKERYRGLPGTYHQDCLLYPRFPERRRASFAHMPGEAYCPGGESAGHRQAKRRFLEFLEDQLSGCTICAGEGRNARPGHFCPPLTFDGTPPVVMPACHGILWFCKSCDQPHLYKLLRDASSVKEEWWTPGRRARIDLALLDEGGDPTALIEIRRKHLSERPFEYAAGSDVPLFVVDVSPGSGVQPRLHDNRQREFIRWPDFSVFPPRSFDFLSYRIDDMHLSCGTDDEGRLEWRIQYDDPEVGYRHIPQPSIGPFILASESTISCEEVRKEVLKGVFVAEGESPDESIDWYDW